MFEVPGSDVKSVHIDEECVKGTCPPQYIKRNHNNSATENPTEPTTPSSTSASTEEEEKTKVRVTQWKTMTIVIYL